MTPIDEENEDLDGEDMNTSQLSKAAPLTALQLAKQKQLNALSNQINKKTNKLTLQQQLKLQNMQQNARTARDTAGGGDGGLRLATSTAEFRSQSLIQKFVEGALSQNQKRTENDLRKIQESHKIDRPEEVNIFHMAFSQLNGRCFVFLAEKDTGVINCVACRESFL